MGDRAYAGTARGAGKVTPSPAVRAPASAAPITAAAPADARFGHDFGKVGVTASRTPPGQAPIQRVRWKWDATTGKWSTVGSSSSTSTPPSHTGRFDGEEFDDSYSQASDPTVRPFLGGGESFMGESGARQQIKGVAPSDTQIRVSAVKTPNLRGGSGLHEVAPTSLRGEIAKAKNPVLAGLQSGLRTSTAHQMFRRTAQKGETAPTGSREVGAHTGFAPKPTGPGSTHTKGQGPAHDTLRDTVRKLTTETDPVKAVNELALSHVESEPTGPEVLQSPYLSGMQPNVQSIGTIGPPVTSPSVPPDPERLKLAQQAHEERERTKTRIRSVKRKRGVGRSPSPPRTRIDDQGKGGEHVTDDPIDYPLSPVPSFEGTPGSFELTANLGGWITAPQREGFQHRPPVTSTTPSSTPPVTPTTGGSTFTTSTVSPPTKKKKKSPP